MTWFLNTNWDIYIHIFKTSITDYYIYIGNNCLQIICFLIKMKFEFLPKRINKQNNNK